MGNTLTGLIPDIFSAFDIVNQEPTGFTQAVMLDASSARAGLNEKVKSFVTPDSTLEDITPGSVAPDTGDQTIGNVWVQITKSKSAPFRWTGEEQLSMRNGPGYAPVRAGQIAQALRKLRNAMEADIGATHVAASRAYGTAGTTPFASNLADPAQIRKILVDNGSDMTDMHLVIDTTAGANLRTLTQLTKANEAGTAATLRQGVLLDLAGFQIRESAGVATHTKGTGTGYVTNTGTTYAVGTTTIAVDTGSGTVVAGDAVTFAGDTNKYIIASSTGGSSVTEIVLGAPGLLQTLADGVAMTILNNHVANLAFHRNAIVLLARQPAMPEEGDAAADVMSMTDPVTGITYEFAMYKEHRRVRYQVGLAWGVNVVKPGHTAVLLG